MRRLLPLLGVVTLAASSAWSAPTISLQDITAFAGDTATLVVSINDEVKGVAGCDLLIKAPGTVEYGPSTIVPLGVGAVETGPFWELNPVVENGQTTGAFDGLFEIAAAQPHGFNGPGVLFRVKMPIHTGIFTDSTYAIRFIEANLFDENGNTIPVEVQNATVSVSGGRMGDVNGDGKVNAGDAILALRVSIGLVTPTARQLRFGDCEPVNSDGTLGDGKINTLDAISILKKSLIAQDRSGAGGGTGGTDGGTGGGTSS